MNILLTTMLTCVALAQQPAKITRGNLGMKLDGHILPLGVIRLKSAIDGRVEKLVISSDTWMVQGQALAYMADKEMATMLDHDKGNSEVGYNKTYQFIPVLCPADCYVMKSLVKRGESVKPGTVLFEAAQQVRLMVEIKPEQSHLVRNGQLVEFWAAERPNQKFQARVEGLPAVSPGTAASFSIDLPHNMNYTASSKWEIRAIIKENAVIVPTAALMRLGNTSYIPMKVETGISTPDYTEISEADENRFILVPGSGEKPSRSNPAPKRERERERERKAPKFFDGRVEGP